MEQQRQATNFIGKQRLRKCHNCDTLAIPDLMMSILDEEGNPAYLCDDCCEFMVRKEQYGKVN